MSLFKTLNRFFSKNPFLITVVFDAVFFYVCFYFVEKYYSEGLPYYDSIGSYGKMFSIMNTATRQGIFAGIQQATEFSLSWVQSFFAVLAGPVLPRTPQSLMVLNFGTLLIAQFSIYQCLKNAQYSRTKILLLSFLPLLPGALMEWVGGYIDMRRDASVVSLLTAVYFFTWRYVWRPDARSALVLGILIGLAQWSRGNILPFLLFILGVPLGVWLLTKKEKYSPYNVLRIVTFPLLVSLFFIVPFYLYNWQPIFQKYSHHADIGGNRFLSLLTFWNVAPALLLGSNQIMIRITSGVTLVAFLLAVVLMRRRALVVRKDSIRKHRPSQLLLSGLIVFGGIMIFNIGLLGLIRLDGYASVIPFFPVLVGLFGIACWVMYVMQMRIKGIHTGVGRGVSITFILILLMVLNTARLWYGMPSRDPSGRKQVSSVVNDLKDVLGGNRVTILWLDHLNVYDLNFYITQAGYVPIQSVSILDGTDTEMRSNIVKNAQGMQAQMIEGLKKQKYIIVSTDTSRYSISSSSHFLYAYAGPVAQWLLQDPGMEKIYTYTFDGVPFVVLKNSRVL